MPALGLSLGLPLKPAAPPLSDGGGGGGDYVAKAGHVNGSSSLTIAAFTFPTGKVWTRIGWFKVGAIPVAGYATIFISDPADQYWNFAAFVNDGGTRSPPYSGVWYGETLNAPDFDENTSGGQIDWDGDNDSITPDQWCCVISVSGGSDDPPFVVAYLGDTAYPVNNGVNQQFLNDIGGSGLSATIFDDTYGGAYTGDAADVRIIAGSLLVDGDIPLATRRKIIDENGKPVDPAALTAFLGGPGPLLLQWTGSEWVNNGTGGAVAPVDGSDFSTATSSPSD